jgi:uncharacterized protein (DUF488 family)
MKYGFTKRQLQEYVSKLGMDYVHFPDLGIDSDRRRNLSKTGSRRLFEDYKKELVSKDIILSNIRERSKQEKVALMCFEKEAKQCHRGVIAESFRKEGLEVTDL